KIIKKKRKNTTASFL
ncbi:alpha-1,2-fucosyltransferase, partial [Helicobacter pylori]